MRLQTICAGLLLAVAGCQVATGSANGEPEDALQATLSGEACPDMGEKAYFFWMEPRSAEPGDQIALFPYWTDMPGAYNDLPAVAWTISAFFRKGR